MWSLGEDTQLAQDLLPVATHLVETTAVTEDDRLLDVACGSGNVALTAWRRGADVTGSDLVPRMLEFARENAAIMGADDIDWRQGDAADLPFEDDSFDVVLSCFGHIAAFDPDAAGRELVRVTKPGGRIAYTSWTPDGLTRPILDTLAEYMPPDAPQDSPADTLWADPEIASERLGKGVDELTVHHEVLPYYFLSPQHFWKHLAENTGPFVAIRSQVSDSDRKALDRSVVEALEPHFEENVFRFEYAIVSARKR
jgi:ubiquinone/menaquinone biosynthesis C-methylase UbiE